MKSTRNVTMKIKWFVVFVSICCFGSGALATDYYVSPTGSASWSACRDINTPCALQTAAQNAVAGDTVYLQGGTYLLPYVYAGGTHYWEFGFTPTNSGTENNPITFMAYPDEYVFLDNSANAGQPNNVSSYGTHFADYIFFDGLNTAVAMSNGLGRGATLSQSTGCVIKNADIQGASGGTSNNNCIRVEKAVSSSIINCKLHGSTGSDNSTGITSYSSSYTEVTNCSFYNNTQGLYDKDGSENNTYTYNFFYNNGTTAYGLKTESTGPNPHDIRLSQNVFVLNIRDIEIAGVKDKSNITVDNNTFYSSGGGGVYLWPDNSVNGLYVYNNIFNGNDPATNYASSINIYSDYNIFYNVGSIGDDSASYTQTSNPNFVNSGGTSPEDYKRTAYPTDGRGGSYPSVRGAYITGNEVIGFSSDGGETPPPPDIKKPKEFQREPPSQ